MNQNSNTTLVEAFENELRISHRTIAKYTDNQQKNISELIQKYFDKLILFGKVPFKTEAIKNSKNRVNEYKTYFLNEPQSTLLLTFMRNSEIVINFKVRLVREFYKMREMIKSSQPKDNIDLDEILVISKKMLELASMFGLSRESRYLSADSGVEKITGNSPLKLLGISQRISIEEMPRI